MSFWVAILLGIIQGFTEFLPVSSSGHLLVFEKLFGVEIDSVFLNVILHIATLLAVCLFYRKTLWQMIRHPFCKQNLFLIVATIPAVLFVLIFGKIFEGFFSSTFFVGIGFLLSSLFLGISQVVMSKTKNFSNINLKNSLFMGFGQALAVFPGISRSGTTLAFGLVWGVDKQKALDFGFLMSIPIILASLVYELVFKDVTLNVDVWGILVSFLCAFVTALLGIKFMQKIVQKLNLWWFSLYLACFGVFVMVFL